MDAVTEYIFRQGLGYVLFLGAIAIAAYLLKALLEAKDKHAQDLREVTTQFVSTSKDLLNGNAALQKSVDAIVNILNNGKK